jgi:hypothetical protein
MQFEALATQEQLESSFLIGLYLPKKLRQDVPLRLVPACQLT